MSVYNLDPSFKIIIIFFINYNFDDLGGLMVFAVGSKCEVPGSIPSKTELGNAVAL